MRFLKISLVFKNIVFNYPIFLTVLHDLNPLYFKITQLFVFQLFKQGFNTTPNYFHRA